MVVESVRVHMLSSRHVVILKETDRDRYLPIWIGPWEASAIAMKLQGLTPERPLTHDLFARRSTSSACTRRPGRRSATSPTRRSTPGSSSSATAGRRGRRPAVRRARAGRPGRCAGSTRRRRCSTRPPSAATRAIGEGDEDEAGADRRSRRPARGSSTRGSTCSATSSTRSTSTRSGRGSRRAELRPPAESAEDRPPRRERPRRGSTHIRSRSRQKSRTARSDHLRLRAGRRAGRPRVVRHADLDDRPARRPQLDQQLGREERATRFDREPSSASRRNSLQAQSTSRDPEAEEDPVGEPVRPGVDDPDRAGPRA